MFAGHRIEAVGGRGGMGIVYKAVHIRLERTVALKVISPELAVDEGFRQRFQREAQLAASIDHPNVIEIYDADEADGQLYITMRWVQGQDLGTMLERTGRLEPETAVRVVGEVGFALDAAHARGLVHRDIKPGNILIADRDGHVYLTDFGLTREAGEGGGLTRTGMFVGTTDYAAPEQIKGGRVDARTDVYALACVLVQALTGRVPYDRDSEMSKMWAHVNDPPPRLRERVADVPEALEEVVEREAHLGDDPHRVGGIEPAIAVEHAAQVDALDPAHGDEQQAVGLGGVVDVDHVGVVDRRGELGLAHEALAEALVGGQLGADDLQRHRALEPEVDGPVDHAHAAAAAQGVDAVAGEDLPFAKLVHGLLIAPADLRNPAISRRCDHELVSHTAYILIGQERHRGGHRLHGGERLARRVARERLGLG